MNLSGEPELVSLKESLLNAAQYRRLDAGHPLQTAALYRLHLAVLHRALRGPKDTATAAEWYTNGFPAAVLQQYLDTHADRFHLFGEEPFMQVAGLDPALEGENFRSHWTRLSSHEGSPNTTALFNVEARPAGNRSDTLTPAQAALVLLEHQSFALGGLIKRFTTSARAAPVATAAQFIAEGGNLHQTLCLNLVPYREDMAAIDLPPWERPQQTVAGIRALYEPEKPVPAKGYASRYTWPSRSVLLLPEESPEGIVVRSVGFGAGEPLEGLGEGAGTNVDPMVTLREGEQPFPFKLRRDRLLWRDLNALLPDPNKIVKDAKGKVKVLPGKPAGTLLNASEVMRKVAQETAQPAHELPALSQTDVPQDFNEGIPDARAAHPVIPVVVFGQITDIGKAGKTVVVRQESYTLPQKFVSEPALFRNEIAVALDNAVKIGGYLRFAVFRLCSELLQKRKRTKDELQVDDAKARNMSAQIPAEPTYWAHLEQPFRTYLLALDSDPKAARLDWQRALVQAARAGWRTAEEAAGMNAVGLRAVQVAGGLLFAVLAQFSTGKQGEENDIKNAG